MTDPRPDGADRPGPAAGSSAARAAARGWSRWGRSPAAVLVLWGLTRAWAVASGLQWVPYPRNDVLYNDVDVYVQWSGSIAHGVFPYTDQMWQYPPLAGLVFVAARLSPFGPYDGFVTLAVLADLALMLVVLREARRRGAWAGAWWWAVAALVVGPIMFGRFDVFPTLAAVIAVASVSRPVRAGIWTAVGALLKVWPVLALLAVPRRSMGRAAAAFAAATVVLLGGLLAWSGGGLSFLRFQQARGLQMEAVAALPWHVVHLLGRTMPTKYRYGAVELDVAGAGLAATVATLLGLLLLAWIAVLRLRGRLERVAPADVVLAATLVAVATSRVFSPQYAVWLLGLGALALTDPRTRLSPVLPLVAVGSLVAQPLYPLWYGELMSGSWFAVLAQCVRVGALVAATVLACVRLTAPTADAPADQAGEEPAEPATSRR